VVALVGCTGVPDGTKAGSDDRPVTLRLATVDPPGRPASDHVEEFARQVGELSDGAIQVEILWEAHELVVPEDHPRPYLALAEMLRESAAELGLVPNFVWAELGVRSLRALEAPFLVTTDKLVAAVVTSELADEMLAGLADVDMVGLALLPETLRHPIGFERPFLVLDDFRGATLRTLSPGAVELLRVLGADGVPLNEDDFIRAVKADQVIGAESAYGQLASLPAPGTFTGNITFFPKVNVLVANASAVEDLHEGQQAILKQAAARTLAHVLATNPTDAESARELCERGGSITVTSAAAVMAIKAAAQPVAVDLERDDTTRAMIERIRALEQQVGTPPAPVVTCAPERSVQAPDTTPTGGPTDSDEFAFPEGTYRMEVSAEFLVAAGLDQGTANDHAGVWTMTFDGGRLDMHDGCHGSYAVADGRVSVRLGDDPTVCGTAAGDEFFSAAWTLQGDSMRFIDVKASEFHLVILFGGKPWTKIG
jgi:TRAP-type C4-dicarboxylate transport system substrate-binding protein